MANKLVLMFDTVSPWSYVGFAVLSRYVPIWKDVQFQFVPINLGMVMKTSGNKPPISVPNKGMWMGREMADAEGFYGVKLKQPEKFPFNSFPLQCHLRTLQERHPDKIPSATAFFFKRIWNEGADVLSLEAIRSEFERWGELKKDELDIICETGAKKETRTQLNSEAEQLVNEGGAFGAPWIVVTRKDGQQKSFFGSDRTEHIAAFLGKPYQGPQPGAAAKL